MTQRNTTGAAKTAAKTAVRTLARSTGAGAVAVHGVETAAKHWRIIAVLIALAVLLPSCTVMMLFMAGGIDPTCVTEQTAGNSSGDAVAGTQLIPTQPGPDGTIVMVTVPPGPYQVTSDRALAKSVAPIAAPYGPNIIGPTQLTAEQAKQWWAGRRGGRQPPKLTVSIYEQIDIIWDEAQAEGLAADIVFAEEVLETGGYTNNGTKYNNFAGIVHYDWKTAEQAAGFPDARAGVRAHIQLLKKVALGNTLTYHRPPVSQIKWAGRTTNFWRTLGDAGWATAPHYGDMILNVYNQIVAYADSGVEPIPLPEYEPGQAPICDGNPVTISAGGYEWALPLPANLLNIALLGRPHHDYAAIDIAVPVGTPITAVTSGTVAIVRNDNYNWFDRGCTATSRCGKCGIGATIVRDDGARFSYCHMSRIDIAVGDQPRHQSQRHQHVPATRAASHLLQPSHTHQLASHRMRPHQRHLGRGAQGLTKRFDYSSGLT